jgi:hypothetical protein
VSDNWQAGGINMAECELPFGSPFTIRQDYKVDGFDEQLRFYRPPPETPIDVFLTVSRRLVCLWSSHVRRGRMNIFMLMVLCSRLRCSRTS